MENNIKINSTKRLTLSALVIALYVIIMFCTQSFAFGQFQIRIATTIYSLSYIFPFLVLPLGIANIISNTIMGGLGVLDMLGGGLVGITTSFLIVLIRKYKLNINLAAIPIIFVPGLGVATWLSYLLGIPYKAMAFSLCVGQVIPGILGVIIIKILSSKIKEIQFMKEITLLGNQNTKYEYDYNPKILERFENKHPDNDYFVKFNCPEFTSLCPITGQPDFATIYISYIPDKYMVESKSLKLYLFTFRNHGDFHEDCMNIIMKDLIKLMEPKYIEVWGKFTPRGGISIDPYCNYGKPGTRREEVAFNRLANHDLYPEKIDNR